MNFGQLLAAGLEHADELTEVAKLGADVYRQVHDWVNGDGPEPTELAQVPDSTRRKLSQARLERLAASGGTGGA